MSKTIKIIIIILVVDLVIVGGYLGYKLLSSKNEASAKVVYEWIQVDEYYTPKDYIEEYIMKDSESQGLLPIFMKNYGRDKKMLKKFRGRNFAGPREGQLKFKYRGMQDWQLMELKFTKEREREIKRAILYIQENGEWKVGDSGTITQ